MGYRWYEANVVEPLFPFGFGLSYTTFEYSDLSVAPRLDPKTGQTVATVSYPYGIMALSASPTALWVATRRRARVQRVDLKTGAVLKTIRVGNNRAEDIMYARGSLWAATPKDNTVYKLSTSTGDVIPISVGQQPRQLAL